MRDGIRGDGAHSRYGDQRVCALLAVKKLFRIHIDMEVSSMMIVSICTWRLKFEPANPDERI